MQLQRGIFISVASLLLLAVTSFSEVKACQFSQDKFSNLDYGLYWYGYGNQCNKAQVGIANANYDPNKKTLIMIHGWQNDSVKNLRRETLNRSENNAGGPDVNLADLWLARGYNVGYLYWNQFADEGEVKDAESKIWSVTAKRGMRWRDSTGGYNNFSENKNVTDLLFESYRDNMQNYNGNNVRFAGHSLGSQLVLTLASRIKSEVNAGNISPTLMPKRIALLDAFFSNSAKSYLNNRWVGAVARDYVADLKNNGVAIESYRSSATTSTVFVGDENKQLHNMTAFSEMRNGYFGWFDFRRKHLAAVWRYLWSVDFLPPSIRGTSAVAPSAATSDARILDMQNRSSEGSVKQRRGTRSKSPYDDTYRYTGRL